MSFMYCWTHIGTFPIGQATIISKHQLSPKPCQTKLLLYHSHIVVIQEAQPWHLPLHLFLRIEHSHSSNLKKKRNLLVSDLDIQRLWTETDQASSWYLQGKERLLAGRSTECQQVYWWGNNKFVWKDIMFKSWWLSQFVDYLSCCWWIDIQVSFTIVWLIFWKEQKSWQAWSVHHRWSSQ